MLNRVHWSSARATTHTCSTMYCGYFCLQWRVLGCALAPASSTMVGCGPFLSSTFMLHRFFLFLEMFSLTLQGSWIAETSFLKSYTLILPSSNLKRFSQSWHHITNQCPFNCDGSRKWLLQAAMKKPQSKMKTTVCCCYRLVLRLHNWTAFSHWKKYKGGNGMLFLAENMFSLDSPLA